MAGAAVLELNDATFDETISSDKPVLVDFWRESCPPCDRMVPLIDEIAKEYEGKLVVAKMDAVGNPETSVKFKIFSVPTLIFFQGGEVRDRLMGAKPKAVLVESIERLI